MEYKAKIAGTINVSPELYADIKFSREFDAWLMERAKAELIDWAMQIDAAFMADLRA